MGRLWIRAFMVLVGIAVVTVYTAGAVGGLLVVQWLFFDPPGLAALLVSLPLVVLLVGYIGYRVGTVRLVASLDGSRLPRKRAPEVYRRIQRLCTRMRVREPPLVVADLGAPNALSMGGPREGLIVVDRSLLRVLTIDELEGILAHELAHMESYDTFLNTLALTATRTVVGLVSVFLLPFVLFLVGIDRGAAWMSGRPARRQFVLTAQFQRGVRLVVGTVFGLFTLAFLAYSRRQEFAADRRAADVTGKPVALARALSKLHRATAPQEGLLSVLYTHDEPRERDRRWLSTHPPIEDRIDRLVERGDHASQRHHIGRIRP